MTQICEINSYHFLYDTCIRVANDILKYFCRSVATFLRFLVLPFGNWRLLNVFLYLYKQPSVWNALTFEISNKYSYCSFEILRWVYDPLQNFKIAIWIFIWYFKSQDISYRWFPFVYISTELDFIRFLITWDLIFILSLKLRLTWVKLIHVLSSMFDWICFIHFA